MSEPKHTTHPQVTHAPGPWAVGRPGPDVTDGWIPVKALHEGCEHWGITVAWALRGHTVYETAEANARLIAAAPDMLDALKWIEKSSSREAFEAVRAAIAKATGAQQ